MTAIDLPQLSKQAKGSVATALDDLNTLAAAVATARASLAAALRDADRAATLGQYDAQALQEFLDRPYVLRKAEGDTYHLIVPRFIGFHGGWLSHHDGAYSVFVVNRFAHLLNPLPGWLAEQLGFGAPAFTATLDGNVLTVAGDAKAAAARIGDKAIVKRDGNRITIRPSSRTDVIRRLIREEGVLPFVSRPIPSSLLRESQVARNDSGHPLFELRAHQARDYARFLELGAALVVAYPQTGKTFLALQAIAEIAGRKLVLCPRRSLVEQWRARLSLYLEPAAAAEVVVSTYQGAARHLDQEWSLVVFDEAHRVPADFAIETATSIRAVARIGLSATPFREDGQHDLMPMLCGFPIGADWPVSSIQRPDVTVWLVPNEAAKIKLARQLCAEPVKGKTFVYTQRLAIGERLAKALGVPFVSGKTKKQLQVIEENDTVVLSSVGDEGLSAGVARIVEVDFLFGSRMQAGQRLGRLAHEQDKRHAGEHHVLMTPDEYRSYGKRLLAYESWGLHVDIRAAEGEAGGELKPARSGRRAPAPTGRRPAAAPPAVPGDVPQSDEVSMFLALRPLASKIREAKDSVGERTALYIERVFRHCFKARFSPEELALGLGIRDAATKSRMRSACKALRDVSLFVEDGEGRFTVDQDEIGRLRALAQAVR